MNPQPKPTPRRILKGLEKRAKARTTAEIRQYVFARERNICRCCRKREAKSMHEIVPRGRGGKVSKKNSIAVCGQLVGTEECCHTYLQQSAIIVNHTDLGAEDTLFFEPTSKQASDWIGIDNGSIFISPTMCEVEAAE